MTEWLKQAGSAGAHGFARYDHKLGFGRTRRRQHVAAYADVWRQWNYQPRCQSNEPAL